MEFKSIEALLDGCRAVYEGDEDTTMTEAELEEAKQVNEGVIDLLRDNPDLTKAINDAHPA